MATDPLPDGSIDAASDPETAGEDATFGSQTGPAPSGTDPDVQRILAAQDAVTADNVAALEAIPVCGPEGAALPSVPSELWAAWLRQRGYTVFPPRPDFIAYVPCSTQLLAELAAKDSQPLVVVGVQPGDAEGSHELLLRRPSRAELQAGMARFRG